MGFLDKTEPALLLLSVGLGLALGLDPLARGMAGAFVSPFLGFMLLGLFWEVPLRDIAKSLRNARFALTAFALNFLWTPLFAWGLSRLFLRGEPSLALGFVLLMVTPCTDWYLVFTGAAKGNVPLSLSLLPLNLACQLLFLPAYILLLGGEAGWADPALVAEGALSALALPLALAKSLRRLLRGREGPTALMEKLFAKRQFLWLWLAICMMFASERVIGAGTLPAFLSILFPALAFFAATLAISRGAGALMGFGRADTVSLVFTALARNSPLALAFAQKAFPGDGLVLVPLVLGPLIELPILALVSLLLLSFLRGEGKGGKG
jgi:ACR3 family arsenite efflux pump ArsB